MKRGLSDVWIVFSMGKVEYAVNKNYVELIGQLSETQVVKRYPDGNIKGLYNICGKVVPLVDGYKMCDQELGMSYEEDMANKLSSLKIRYMRFLLELDNSTDLELIKDKDYKRSVEDLKVGLKDNIDRNSNSYEYVLTDRIVNHVRMNMHRVNSILNKYSKGEVFSREVLKEVDEVKRDSKRHILDAIDKVINSYNDKKLNYIMFKCRGVEFAVWISEILKITDNIMGLSRERKNLSAGTILVGEKVVNVIDVLKLMDMCTS